MKERRFPIMDGPSVPWSMVAPYEMQAKANHGQSLDRLAERGGLDPVELWCIVHSKRLRDGIGNREADLWLRSWLDADWRTRCLAAEAKLAAAERVVEAACMWRHGMVPIGTDYVDADDGNAEPNLKRRPSRCLLVEAVDEWRKALPGEGGK